MRRMMIKKLRWMRGLRIKKDCVDGGIGWLRD